MCNRMSCVSAVGGGREGVVVVLNRRRRERGNSSLVSGKPILGVDLILMRVR